MTDGKWHWTGRCNERDTPRITILGRSHSARRVVYEEYIGEIPDGKCVGMSCGEPDCVNPAHMFISSTSGIKKALDRDKNKPRSLDERFDECFVRDSPDACWEWKGMKGPSGYGRFFIGKENGRPRFAFPHRYMFERENGAIPEGLIIDHICRNRSCVNPNHLRVVTYSQNMENISYRRKSKSGIRGVSVRNGKYVVQCMKNGIRHKGGTFDSLEEAAKASVALRNRWMTCNNSDLPC